MQHRSRVWNEAHAGDRLTDFARGDDGHSYRYAVVNVGGDASGGLERNRDRVVERLGYRFEPATG